MQEGEEEWCEYHGRLWERHRAAGYCMTQFPDRSWCSRPADSVAERCNDCLEREISEAVAAKAKAEQEAERQRKFAEEQKRQQEENKTLEAQPWFPALVRYLDGRLQGERYEMEEWMGKNYVADKWDAYYWN